MGRRNSNKSPRNKPKYLASISEFRDLLEVVTVEAGPDLGALKRELDLESLLTMPLPILWDSRKLTSDTTV